MKTVLITGCNRGLGLEASRQYAQDGYQIIACCREPKNAGNLIELQQQFPKQITIEALDVSSADAINTLAEKYRNQSIDILFHNAGVWGGPNQSLGELEIAQWQETLLIDAIAPVLMAQAFLPQIRAGKEKVIALMSSKMGSVSDNTSGGRYYYRTAKSALNSAGKSLAEDLGCEGITVVIMHPGWVRTDMGGPNGLIDAPESVSGLRSMIKNMVSEQRSGEFRAYDGELIPW